jgi:secreted trypsin-like serine protease
MLDSVIANRSIVAGLFSAGYLFAASPWMAVTAKAQSDQTSRQLESVPTTVSSDQLETREIVLDLSLNKSVETDDEAPAIAEQSDAFYERGLTRVREDNEDDSTSRIVSGFPARPGAWPSTVELQLNRLSLKNGARATILCAGSIIDERWVLTAAHCLGYPDEKVEAATAFEGSNLHQRGRPIKVSRFKFPKQFDSRTKVNDIALLQLSRPAKAPRQKLTAGSGRSTFLAAGNMATIVGWGLTTEGGQLSNQLLQANVPIVDQQACAAAYRRVNGVVTETSFCAGLPEGGVDACQGDSGGPLYIAGANGEPVQAGIVSWGEGCARKEFPGVYSAVPHFERWIRQFVPNATFVLPRKPAEPASKPAEPTPTTSASLQTISGGQPGGDPRPTVKSRSTYFRGFMSRSARRSP